MGHTTPLSALLTIGFRVVKFEVSIALFRTNCVLLLFLTSYQFKISKIWQKCAHIKVKSKNLNPMVTSAGSGVVLCKCTHA